MKFYKAKKLLVLGLALVLCFGSFIGSTPEKVNAYTTDDIPKLQQEINKIQSSINSYKQNISSTTASLKTEQQKQNEINTQIYNVQKLINKYQEAIDLLNTHIDETEQSLVEQEQKINEGIDLFEKRVRAMYIAGQDASVTALIGSDDFFDFLTRNELIKRSAEYDNELIENLVAEKKAFEMTKKELEEAKGENEKYLDEQQSAISDLNTLYSQSQQAIDELNAEKANYEKLSAEEKSKLDDFEKELDRLIKEKQNKENGYVGGTFTWPVPGFYYISSPYGPRWGKLHGGIDIASGGNGSIYRANIVAANSGTVILAQPNATLGYSYGKYVVIDHGGGYTTLYAHCDSLASGITVGSHVEKGQTIAYVGTTGHSTGYHLHFEIRVNGVRKDPMAWFTKK